MTAASAEIVLLHSALGLRPAVHRTAERLRADGRVVHVPDLYDGRVFDDVDAGVAHLEGLGWGTVVGRAEAAVAALPAQVVYAGWSMGAGVAQVLVRRRPECVGALLLEGGGAEPGDAWPAVPVAVHHAVDDPWVDAGLPALLLDAAARSQVPAELHVYPAHGHLFTDDDLPQHDAASAARLWGRVATWLRELP
jgi:dienelactone hydrolase